MTIPMILGAAVALMQTVATAVPVRPAQQPASPTAARAVTPPTPGSTWGAPPDAWAAQDPADSLYRAARRALNRNDYNGAAAQFRSISRRFPRSAYAGDALYWEAFALYRAGGTEPKRCSMSFSNARRMPFWHPSSMSCSPTVMYCSSQVLLMRA